MTRREVPAEETDCCTDELNPIGKLLVSHIQCRVRCRVCSGEGCGTGEVTEWPETPFSYGYAHQTRKCGFSNSATLKTIIATIQLCFLPKFPCPQFLKGTRYFPGLLRYETLTTRPNATRFLTDLPYHWRPHFARVVTIRGRQFLVPGNAYQAMFFLPAPDYEQTWREAKSDSEELKRQERKMWRPFWSTYWLHPKRRTKVIPLDTFEDHLVQHLGSKYIGRMRRHVHKGGVHMGM